MEAGLQTLPKPIPLVFSQQQCQCFAAPGSEMPITIQSMIRMCIPGMGCFLPGSFPAQGGSKQGSVLLIYIGFFLYKFLETVDGRGAKRTEDNLTKIGRAQTPPLPGPCWSQGLGSALLSTLLAFLGGVEHHGAGQSRTSGHAVLWSTPS